MLNYIWAFMILFSLICAHFTGRLDECVNAGLAGASDGVAAVISMCGMLALWSGLLNIAEKSGLSGYISKIVSPLVRRIFKDIPKDSPAVGSMVMNITSNILGLGNSATPLGIAAMKQLDSINPDKRRASDAMCMFVILNTASVQLIPTTIISLRTQAGSAAPSDVIVPIWIASAAALFVGLSLAKFFKRRWR